MSPRLRSLALLPIAILGTLAGAEERPNIILVMADDLGIAQVETYGYDYGTRDKIKTPHLNEMAANGLRFNRFYSQAPVCSPTRVSCYTGRHPYRMGVWEANKGHLRPEEVTLPEILQKNGYTVGHFGKWHMGRMIDNDPKLGKKSKRMAFSSPEENGVDEWFAIHTSPALYNPFSAGRTKATDSDNPYYHNGKRVTENLEGDTSRIIMDRAIPFMKKAAQEEIPFLCIIWLNTPHAELDADPAYQSSYNDYKLFGAIEDMDKQIGRLRKELRQLGIADNTLLWFSSDNGQAKGGAGPFLGGKRHLFEGGIRVPTIAEWPNRIKAGSTSDGIACSSDYLPTLLSAAGIEYDSPYPLDGENILSLLEGEDRKRDAPLCFQSHGTTVVMDGDYKLVKVSAGAFSEKLSKERSLPIDEWMLFDLQNDPGETQNIAMHHPERVAALSKHFENWDHSCRNSYDGLDYPNTFDKSTITKPYLNDLPLKNKKARKKN